MAELTPPDVRSTPRRSWAHFVLRLVLGRISHTLGHVGAGTMLLVSTVRFAFARPFSVRNLVGQFAKVGVQSLPVVTITGSFVGMVLALQGYHQLKLLGAEGLLGSFVSTAAIKELGAMLTGFVLSGRIGAAITAELGTMKVTEQIDAIEAMGASPVQYLVVPRFIACTVMLPILSIFSNILAIAGGYLLAVNFLGVNGEFFLDMATSARGFSIEDVFTSMLKASTFGMIIATIGCYMGFSVSPASGAEGVGKATTSCAVLSLVLILITDFLIEFINREVLGL